MKAYVLTLVGVAMVSGIVNLLAPDGEIKRYVRLATAFCLICATANPMVAFLKNDGWESFVEGLSSLGEISDGNYDEIYKEHLISVGEERAENIIKNNIIEEFSLAEESFDVRVDFESKNGNSKIAELRILLRASAVFVDPRELISYVEEKYGCSAIIVYD